MSAPPFCAESRTGKPLRVLWIWHAAVVAEYQKPLALLGECADLQVTLLVPKRWPERAGQMVHAERGEGAYRLIAARTLFTGFYYVYFYPSLLWHLWRVRPDVIYCYEEAHTLIAALVLLTRRLAMRRSRVLLYAAQNIKKQYPLPFRLFEKYCFRRADGILACGTRVAETLRQKGYRGPLRVVPLPTDTVAFAPDPAQREGARREYELPPDALAIGYAGKLVEEKGLPTLLRAFAEIGHENKNAYLLLAGGGPLQEKMEGQAQDAGLAKRVRFLGVVHNSDLPAFMNALDVFVLPSETRPNWREQFGRVLVEAMSCGVATIGSNSGEIPTVLGDAGLVFPEGDAPALAAHLRALLQDSAVRHELALKGRQRVMSLFSTEQVAAQHYAVYRDLAT